MKHIEWDSQAESGAMLDMVGWANRRLGLFEGGDYCIVVHGTLEGYVAVLLDAEGRTAARWEAPSWAGALLLAVQGCR